MALTDNPNTKHLVYKQRNSNADGSRWSDKQKLEAIQSYLLLGNLSMTARILNIPEDTLRQWKQKDWWAQQVDDLKMQDKLVLSGKVKAIGQAAMSAVEDRLTNGDFIYDQKTGEMRRKPVAMKDAHKVAVDMLAQQNLLEKGAEGPAQEQKDDDRLLKLAEKFATFVQAKKEVPLVVDVSSREVEDAVVKE